MTVYINPDFADERIREELFAGSFIVLTGCRQWQSWWNTYGKS